MKMGRNNMKCPECTTELKYRGYTGGGHSLYYCSSCKKEWEIGEGATADHERNAMDDFFDDRIAERGRKGLI